MRIREYTPADFEALRRMHAAQGFGYPLPDLDSPLLVVKLVLEDDGREVICGREEVVLDAGGPRLEAGTLEAGSRRQEAGAVGNRRSLGPSQQSPAAGGHPSARSAGLRASESRITNHKPQIVMAILLRLTAETYLLHDPTAGSPRSRWRNLLALHEAARQSATSLGLDDVQAFLPPRVARAFGRRLARLGWRSDPWPCLSRRLP